MSLPNVTFINLQAREFEEDLKEFTSKFGVLVHNFNDLDHYENLDEVAALGAALDVVISVSTCVSTLTAGVGTPTKMLHWRQSPWNNITNTPPGPDVKVFERNTWETWEKCFAGIASEINHSLLQYEKPSTLEIDKLVKIYHARN